MGSGVDWRFAPGADKDEPSDGWWLGADGVATVQRMTEAVDDRVVQLGIRSILDERGKWNPTFPLLLDAAKALLKEQPDFAAQEEWLTEVVKASGGRILYYPEFHYELNWIRRAWAFTKADLKHRCDYTFPSLRKNFPLVPDSLPSETAKKFFMHCVRYMQCYKGVGDRELTPAMIKFAMHEYRGHPCIPAAVFAAFEVKEG